MIKKFFLLGLSLFLWSSTLVDAKELKKASSVWTTIGQDYSNFYTDGDRWMRLGVAFGSMSVVANTPVDQNIRNWYQDNIRTQKSDDFAVYAKMFGEGKYEIPISLLASSINLIDDDSSIGFWGARVARTYLVGSPALLAAQRLTGALRPSSPTDNPAKNSYWKPFNAENGVSGHSFMGAVPFVVIARMYSDNPYVKYGAYFASTLAAWSRVNDDKHYTSQIILGWYMAYESVDAVFETDRKKDKWTFSPMIGKGFYGIALNSRW